MSRDSVFVPNLETRSRSMTSTPSSTTIYKLATPQPVLEYYRQFNISKMWIFSCDGDVLEGMSLSCMPDA